MSNCAKSQQHSPDASRLPKCVTGWQPVDPKRLWNDGTQILAAVPVCGISEDGWHYEYSVVVIDCDGEFFALRTDFGEPWGWTLEDIDFYVVLSE